MIRRQIWKVTNCNYPTTSRTGSNLASQLDRRRSSPISKNNTSSSRFYSASSTSISGSNLTLPPTLHSLLSSLPSTPSSEIPTLTLTLRIQTLRSHSKLTFLTLTDHSLPSNEPSLQAVISGRESHNRLPKGTTIGSTISLTGRFAFRDKKKREDERSWEFKVDNQQGENVGLIAGTDNSIYPFPISTLSSTPPIASSTIPSSNFSSNLHRLHPHLRSRLSRHSSLLRIRHSIEKGLENWFDRNSFVKCYPPILTTGDCEGAGEAFLVNTNSDKVSAVEALEQVNSDSTQVSQSKETSLDSSSATSSESRTFFNPQVYLTVSTQLHLEALSQGLGRVWTSSPVFRAEGSATNRHLAEFWMLEAEWNAGVVREEQRESTENTDSSKNEIETEKAMLDELMNGTESLLKSTMRYVLGIEELPNGEQASRKLSKEEEDRRIRNRNEVLFLHQSSDSSQDSDSTKFSQLEEFSKSSNVWPRISYTEAVEILSQVHEGTIPIPQNSISFDPPKWGESLSSAQEKYLSTSHFKSPIFIYDYPINIKSFYMRENSPNQQSIGRTVSCFDLLIPGIGELVGGSVREERKDRIQSRMVELGLLKDEDGDGHMTSTSLDWYAQDLRTFGPFQTVGFGIGIERLVSWLTRTENIRDCTTWIRTKGNVRG